MPASISAFKSQEAVFSWATLRFRVRLAQGSIARYFVPEATRALFGNRSALTTVHFGKGAFGRPTRPRMAAIAAWFLAMLSQL